MDKKNTPETVKAPRKKPKKILPLRDLSFTYPFYKNMHSNNVIFCFLGVIDPDLLLYILDIMEDALEEASSSRKLTKRVGNVMVECLTSLYSSEKAQEYAEHFKEYDPRAIFVVRKLTENSFLVSAGQYIDSKRIKFLKKLMSRISKLTPEEIKDEYKKMLISGGFDEESVLSLSVLDLARKAGGDIRHSFEFINTRFSFFTIEAKISR